MLEAKQTKINNIFSFFNIISFFFSKYKISKKIEKININNI